MKTQTIILTVLVWGSSQMSTINLNESLSTRFGLRPQACHQWVFVLKNIVVEDKSNKRQPETKEEPIKSLKKIKKRRRKLFEASEVEKRNSRWQALLVKNLINKWKYYQNKTEASTKVLKNIYHLNDRNYQPTYIVDNCNLFEVLPQANLFLWATRWRLALAPAAHMTKSEYMRATSQIFQGCQGCLLTRL